MQAVQTKVDLKPLELLEQKIQRAVEAITRLKGENAALRTQIASFQATAADAEVRTRELDTARTSAQALERELASLREDRAAVIARVDGLLKDLDKLNLDA
jgi:FtsZ-binding cell division protein ZapB